MKVKILESLDEIAQGKLLKIEDFEGLEEIKVTKTIPEFEIELPGVCDYSHTTNYSKQASLIKISFNSLERLAFPIIRGCIALNLVVKWCQADAYLAKARSYHLCNLYNQYQRSVMLCVYAFDHYKTLINELLSYFEPNTHQAIKSRIFYNLLWQIPGRAIRDLEYGLIRDIDFHKNSAQNTPEPLIHSWIELLGVAAALLADCVLHITHQDIKDDLAIRNQGLQKCREHLAAFMARRNPALNNSEINASNPLSVKVPRALLLSTYSLTLFTNICSGDIISREKTPLLDLLAGHTPIYLKPRSAPANALDRDIILEEKSIVEEIASNPNSLLEWLALALRGEKLLVLIHMRYKSSLDDNRDSYLGIFVTNAITNKEQYYKILNFYLEDIIIKALSQSLNILKIYHNPGTVLGIKPNTYAIAEISALAQELEFYVHQYSAKFNNTLGQKCTDMLLKLSSNLENFNITFTEQSRVNDLTTNKIRKRHAANLLNT